MVASATKQRDGREPAGKIVIRNGFSLAIQRRHCTIRAQRGRKWLLLRTRRQPGDRHSRAYPRDPRRLRLKANPDDLDLSQVAGLLRLEENGEMTNADHTCAHAMQFQPSTRWR